MNSECSNFHALDANANRFAGFAGTYDGARPRTPLAILDLLCEICGSERPSLVVDLGCGTGLSTRVWADRAERVIGFEPSDDMRNHAESRANPPNVTFRKAYSHETGLPEHCADIITCSQSLHWMEPQATFEEARRILRQGGVFCAYDYDRAPSVPSVWEAEAAYREFGRRVNELDDKDRPRVGAHRWEKEEHIGRMKRSGCFRYTRELLIHSRESGDAGRLFRYALSHGGYQSLLKAGISEEELGVPELRETFHRLMGDKPVAWHWSYRLRLGVA